MTEEIQNIVADAKEEIGPNDADVLVDAIKFFTWSIDTTNKLKDDQVRDTVVPLFVEPLIGLLGKVKDEDVVEEYFIPTFLNKCTITENEHDAESML